MNDIQETCQKNATSALLVGRKDLVQVLCTLLTAVQVFPFEQVVVPGWLWLSDILSEASSILQFLSHFL